MKVRIQELSGLMGADRSRALHSHVSSDQVLEHYTVVLVAATAQELTEQGYCRGTRRAWSTSEATASLAKAAKVCMQGRGKPPPRSPQPHGLEHFHCSMCREQQDREQHCVTPADTPREQDAAFHKHLQISPLGSHPKGTAALGLYP